MESFDRGLSNTLSLREGICTREQVIDVLKADRNLGKNLEAPSVSYGAINLYMRGVLEEETKPNLSKVLHFIQYNANTRSRSCCCAAFL